MNDARFRTTSWSLVLAAPESSGALADLCTRYWSPVFAFIRGRGYSVEEAEDRTQAFFAHLLSKDRLRYADPSRGRFRSFLLTSVQHFLSNELDRARTQKRGGDRSHVELMDVEVHDDEDPEKVFAKRWAMSVLQTALDALRTELENPAHLALLTPSRGDYATLAEEMGTTEGTLRVAAHRVRRKFRDHLRRVVAETVADPAQIDDEIRFLIDAVSA